jgi:hypothetical protein
MGGAEANQIGFVGASDGIDRVVYRGMHDGKAAGGVDCCGLRAWGADDHQKCSVPLDHLAHRFGCVGHCGREVRASQYGNSSGREQ